MRRSTRRALYRSAGSVQAHMGSIVVKREPVFAILQYLASTFDALLAAPVSQESASLSHVFKQHPAFMRDHFIFLKESFDLVCGGGFANHSESAEALELRLKGHRHHGDERRDEKTTEKRQYHQGKEPELSRNDSGRRARASRGERGVRKMRRSPFKPN